MTFLDVVIGLFYLTGAFFNLSTVVGILRLPDLYCRLHSSSKNTTLGSLLILFGLALRDLQWGEGAAALKLIAIAILLLIVNPIGSHALARASYKYGIPLWQGSVIDQTPGA
jgi:multicomponent Na+:H+ antiporter subunit G